jgi:hypothetical protein
MPLEAFSLHNSSLFYRHHNPPHFHVEYQGQNAPFDFDEKLIEGEIDSRAAKDLIKSGQV